MRLSISICSESQGPRDIVIDATRRTLPGPLHGDDCSPPSRTICRANAVFNEQSSSSDRLRNGAPAPVIRLASAVDVPSLVESFGHAAGKLGFPRYVISRVTRSRSTRAPQTALEMIGSHYPKEWVRHYQCRDYASIDPVHRAAFFQSAPYRWYDIIDLTKADHRFLGEASEAGLRAGLSVPVHQSDGSILLFNLAGPLQSVNSAINARLAYLISAQFNFELHRLGLTRSRRAARLLTPCQIECLTWAANAPIASLQRLTRGEAHVISRCRQARCPATRNPWPSRHLSP